MNQQHDYRFTFSFTGSLLSVDNVAPDGRVGVPYSHQIIVSGGTPPYSFQGVSMPPGLSVDGNGLISGTVQSEVLSFPAHIRISDSGS